MRIRQYAASKPDEIPAAECAVAVERRFTPSDLDLDDLAEAIRVLLGPENALSTGASNQPDSALLSSETRAIHVWEAKEAP
jgi:hypothetical protein